MSENQTDTASKASNHGLHALLQDSEGKTTYVYAKTQKEFVKALEMENKTVLSVFKGKKMELTEKKSYSIQ